MTPCCSPLDTRPSPPAYSEALHYPQGCQTSGLELQKNCDNSCINTDVSSTYDSNIVPGEIVYLCKSAQSYCDSKLELCHQWKYICSLRQHPEGKSIVILESTPKTLASSSNGIGGKTYERIEVVEASERNKEDTSMCVTEEPKGVSMVRDPEMLDSAQTTAKSCRMPLNGIIYNDRMVVESLLTDVCNLPPPPCQLLESDSDKSIEEDETELIHVDKQLDQDLENLSLALDNSDDLPPVANGVRCVHFEEYTPFLSETNAHLTTFRKPNEITECSQSREGDPDLENAFRKSNEVIECKMQIRQDSEADYADSGYSDSHRPEIKDSHAQNIAENVIYSVPNRSSSDLSIKCDDDTVLVTQSIEKHQRTLKRTNNGAQHTVYDLCPSESFYNSAESMPTDVKTSSFSSHDQANKTGPKFSSLTDVSRNRLSLDSSVSFHKQVTVNTDNSCSSCKIDHQDEAEVRISDADPLVTTNSKASSSAEALSTQLMLEDSRTYYRRKAADRGTLYCAGCGISVVATIVFLLIYFS